jgi:hypothetical protein
VSHLETRGKFDHMSQDHSEDGKMRLGWCLVALVSGCWVAQWAVVVAVKGRACPVAVYQGGCTEEETRAGSARGDGFHTPSVPHSADFPFC